MNKSSKIRSFWKFFLISLVLIVLVALMSISIGSRENNLQDVYNTLILKKEDPLVQSVIIQRIPRTIYGFMAGAALSVSGILMQTLTRNPIADPSILGVNSGAALFVVLGIALFNIGHPIAYMIFALIGGFLASFLVYGISGVGGSPTPIKLALAGSAITMTCNSLISMVTLINKVALEEFRFWQVGGIGGASFEKIAYSLPIIAICIFISILLIPSLNALMLGDEMATSLGVNVVRVRTISMIIGVILCAIITAMCGPISFIGLMVPHIIRQIFSSNMEILIPYSCILGGSLLVLFDVLGRYLGSPGEIQVGIITAIFGAPVFILIARRTRVKSL